MWTNNFSDSFVFCSRMFCFILQTSECFRWVSLTNYNHSAVATVCWNAVTSVKNNKQLWTSTVHCDCFIFWSTVRCLLRTDIGVASGGKRGHDHPDFWKTVSLCFERHFSKQNSVICLKLNILAPQMFGLATSLRTDHNKKVKPPVSHAAISKETVFRKIHFILAYAETIIKRFWKGVIYRPVLHLHTILAFCAVLWNRSCR